MGSPGTRLLCGRFCKAPVPCPSWSDSGHIFLSLSLRHQWAFFNNKGTKSGPVLPKDDLPDRTMKQPSGAGTVGCLRIEGGRSGLGIWTTSRCWLQGQSRTEQVSSLLPAALRPGAGRGRACVARLAPFGACSRNTGRRTLRLLSLTVAPVQLWSKQVLLNS